MRRKKEKPNPTAILNESPAGRAILAVRDKALRVAAATEYLELRRKTEPGNRLNRNLAALCDAEIRRRVAIERYYRQRLDGEVSNGVSWPCPV